MIAMASWCESLSFRASLPEFDLAKPCRPFRQDFYCDEEKWGGRNKESSPLFPPDRIGCDEWKRSEAYPRHGQKKAFHCIGIRPGEHGISPFHHQEGGRRPISHHR